jgi:hypothetical protein
MGTLLHVKKKTEAAGSLCCPIASIAILHLPSSLGLPCRIILRKIGSKLLTAFNVEDIFVNRHKNERRYCR